MRAPGIHSLMGSFRLDRESAKLIRLAAKVGDAELEEVIEKRFPETHVYVRSLYSSPYRSEIWRVTVRLHAIDSVLGTYGVEALGPGRDGDHAPPYEYLNAGDRYATTLIYRRATDSLSVGTWGDIAERHPRWP